MCSIILINWVCWPWIVFKRLSWAIQKLWAKHFYHYPIYLVILQMVIRCPIPNLCLEFYIYTLQLSSIYWRVIVQIPRCSTKVLGIWISWHCGNEQFYLELILFYCYLKVHWKILNSIHAMLQNCKHLPTSKIL
jgi:hypothetical protein